MPVVANRTLMYVCNGNRFTKVQAQSIGEHWRKLREDNGDNLTEKMMLQDARSKKSPVHPHLEWDNGKCGDKFRTIQIREIKAVVHVVLDDGVNTIQAFHTVPDVDKHKPRQIVPVDEVAVNEKQTAFILDQAEMSLKRWKDRYSSYRKHLKPGLLEILKTLEDYFEE